MALTKVAALIWDGVSPFEFGVLCEAFGIDRRDHGVPVLDFGVCAPEPGLVRTNLGFGIEASHGLDVATLARRSLMSPRTFARRFRAETGATPHAWLTSQRLLRAEQLLEQTDRPVERIATEVGFGNAATLRHHFGRVRGISPQAYRRRFAC